MSHLLLSEAPIFKADSVENSRDICFVAEHTLGKLAKWLRMLGFDTVYESDLSLKISYEKGRIRLTRSRRMGEKNRREGLLFIASDHYMEQLRQVIKAVEIIPDDLRPFSRCIRCNRSILPVDKDSVQGRIPDYIFETHDSFQICDQCNRIYWSGSHTQQSMDLMKQLFD